MVAELESKVICAVWARIMRGYGIGTTLLIKNVVWFENASTKYVQKFRKK